MSSETHHGNGYPSSDSHREDMWLLHFVEIIPPGSSVCSLLCVLPLLISRPRKIDPIVRVPKWGPIFFLVLDI